ncbi:PrgI family protein [Candidatus Daviesbacteria bacterium]|nr:PrgI family protein [Candidatus Daviesbacteria bacterium]
MEAHPIPQNVTSFQFKLVGDMTLKQFIYLSSGMGIAYLTFVLLAAPAPLLAWPLIFLFAFLGIALAFIPITDRPLDHWLKAFLRAVYLPTKRVWQKQGRAFPQNPLFLNRLNVYLSTQGEIKNPIPIPLATPALSIPLPKTVISTGPSLPTPEELTKTVKLAQQAQSLQVKIIEGERELKQIKQSMDAEKFNVVFANLQNLVQDAQQIRQQLAQVTKEEPLKEAPKLKVEVVPAPKPKQTKLVLTTAPNVINGIVVDAENNYLEGVVVVIHDKEGLPVRALKTNKLGQFTGSTPLANGSYTIELEKDNLIFDLLKIELDGKILPPLTIAAKRVYGNNPN